MQDAQNLSNPAPAFAATWNLASALQQLAKDGLEPIVVGIHHAGEARLAEYSPSADSRDGGGRGDAYLRERSTARPGAIYLDVGTAEGPQALRDVRHLRRILLAKGKRMPRLTYLEAEAAPHRESAWAERLPHALHVLLGADAQRDI
jgi:predicted alpha/beta superfamily hydrolase